MPPLSYSHFIYPASYAPLPTYYSLHTTSRSISPIPYISFPTSRSLRPASFILLSTSHSLCCPASYTPHLTPQLPTPRSLRHAPYIPISTSRSLHPGPISWSLQPTPIFLFQVSSTYILHPTIDSNPSSPYIPLFTPLPTSQQNYEIIYI